jgi:hypothetical protein
METFIEVGHIRPVRITQMEPRLLQAAVEIHVALRNEANLKRSGASDVDDEESDVIIYPERESIAGIL